jgi:hypothetical protein
MQEAVEAENKEDHARKVSAIVETVRITGSPFG